MKTLQDKIEDAGYNPDDVLKMNGFDDCIIGIVESCTSAPVLCYDKEKVIQKNMKDGMTREEAEEFFSFNQIGAYMGETTPCFIELFE